MATQAAIPLFDAVSAVLGISPVAKSYGTQSILRMERVFAEECDPNSVRRLIREFPFEMVEKDILMIDWGPFFRRVELFPELRKERTGDVACAFFSAISDAALKMAVYAADVTKLRKIVLSGSAFQSPSLTYMISEQLRRAEFNVYHHEKTSPDESSVSIGQAVFGGNA